MLNVFEELGETSRRQIMAELRTGPKSVNEIVAQTHLKQPNVSNHLARMKTKNIVKAHKVGRQVFYSLASPEVEAVVHAAFATSDRAAEPVEMEDLAKEYAKYAVAGDESACQEVLEVAYRARLPLLDIYSDVLTPAMTMVGTWYKVNAIDEGQEHMASAITERMLARTLQIAGFVKRINKTAVLGCAPNCWHVIGIRMISDYLRLCGWKTLYLGGNVPASSFVSTVRQHHPDLVLISCAAQEGLEESLDLVRRLSAARSGRHPFVIGVGGISVNLEPDRFAEAGADFAAKDLRAFAQHYLPSIEKSGQVAEPALR